MKEKTNQLHCDVGLFSRAMKQVAIMETEALEPFQYVRSLRKADTDLKHSGQRVFHEHVNEGPSLSAGLLLTETLMETQILN